MCGYARGILGVGGEVVHAGTVVAGIRESTLLACWMSTGLPELLHQDSFEMTVPEDAPVLGNDSGVMVAGSGLGEAVPGGKPSVAGLVRHVGALGGWSPADQGIFGHSGSEDGGLLFQGKMV